MNSGITRDGMNTDGIRRTRMIARQASIPVTAKVRATVSTISSPRSVD